MMPDIKHPCKHNDISAQRAYDYVAFKDFGGKLSTLDNKNRFVYEFVQLKFDKIMEIITTLRNKESCTIEICNCLFTLIPEFMKELRQWQAIDKRIDFYKNGGLKEQIISSALDTDRLVRRSKEYNIDFIDLVCIY